LDPSKYSGGVLNPVIGDEARHSTVAQDTTVAKAIDLATVAAYLDTEITEIINAIAALQADLGDPSADATTLYARLLEVRTQVNKMLFDASSYVKSTPQTVVTVNPGQLLGGALQPLLPIHATATIEAPQGDAYPIPWALGSGAAKADAKFYYIAKENESDSDAAAAINQEITIADPANVAGMNVLTTVMTATKKAYHAKVKRVDADGVSNPLTVWKGKLNIVPNVG
jgi:hypothetical protein